MLCLEDNLKIVKAPYLHEGPFSYICIMARQSESTNQSALDKELEKLEKDFGKGTVITSATFDKVDVISTGSLKLDLATGIGGFPRSKVVELMGWESSGKSTIALNLIANAQKAGLKSLLVDGENSFDAKYAKALGVQTDNLLIRQLDEGGGERCYDIIERLIKTKELGLVIIDSQTSLLPKKILEEENGTNALGLHARLMSTSVPKIVNAAALGNTLVVYISQFREKIGVMYGSPETTNGGNALRFYCHMRVEVRKSVEKEDGVAIANKTRCKVIKNKLASPFGEAEFRIDFGVGINRAKEILDLAEEFDIIKRGGSWYSYGEIKVGQGENNALQFFRDNPEFAQDIEKQVLIKYKEKNNGRSIAEGSES